MNPIPEIKINSHTVQEIYDYAEDNMMDWSADQEPYINPEAAKEKYVRKESHDALLQWIIESIEKGHECDSVLESWQRACDVVAALKESMTEESGQRYMNFDQLQKEIIKYKAKDEYIQAAIVILRDIMVKGDTR